MEIESFKKGLVIYSSFPDTINNPIVAINKIKLIAGSSKFDVIEIPYYEESLIWDIINKEVKVSQLELIVSAGPLCVINNLNLSSLDSIIRNKSIAKIKNVIDFAYHVNARSIVVMSGRKPHINEWDIALNNFVSSLNELCAYSLKHKTDYVLTISVEPADSDLEHLQLIGASKEAKEVLLKVRDMHDNVSITMDMSHVAQLGETIEEATCFLGPLVSHAHIANAVVANQDHPYYGDKHPPFNTFGGSYSVSDIKKYVRFLFKNCFSNGMKYPYGLPVISLEIKPLDISMADEVFIDTASLFEQIQ